MAWCIYGLSNFMKAEYENGFDSGNKLKRLIFWYVMSYSPTKVNKHFEGFRVKEYNKQNTRMKHDCTV
jgi:hypothetical protein